MSSTTRGPAEPADDTAPGASVAGPDSGGDAGTEPPAPPQASLRSRALKGSVWALGGYGTMTVLRFVSNLVLAHALFPEAFGLVAMSSILLQGLEMFSDLGIGVAIVQSPRGDDPRFLNTAWTAKVIRGVILWAAAASLAWPMSQLYKVPELKWFIPVCALSFITTGLQSTNIATISRRVDVKTVTLFGLAECLLKTGITIAWAELYPSVWALVGGSIITYTLSMIATHVVLPGIRNRFAWDSSAARSLMRFGTWIFVSTMLTFLAQQTDRLLLGWLAPLGILGVYSMSYNLARLPMDVGSQIAGSVLYPALAEIVRRDRSAIESKLREAREIILAATQFGIVCVIFLAPWFFHVFYDSRYSDGALFAPILATAVWISILQASADRTLLALGDARSLAMSNLANVAVTLQACVVGYWLYGMPGFIAGYGLGNLAGHVVVVISMARHGLRILSQDLRNSGLIALVCGLGLAVPRWVVGTSRGSPVDLAFTTAAVAVSGAYAYARLRPVIFEFLARRSAS